MKFTYLVQVVVCLGASILPSFGQSAGPWKLDSTLPAHNDVEGDFRISSDGQRVVYRAHHGESQAVVELYGVPLSGGTPIRLNGSLTAGGEVSAWEFSPDSSRVVYWADQDTDELTEVYVVPITGGSLLHLSDKLVERGSDGGGFAGAGGDRVVYRGVATSGPFSGSVVELFSAPAIGGDSIKLNGPLTSGGDVKSVRMRPDGSRVVYLADQDTDDTVELFGVSAGAGPPVKLNPPLAAGGEVYADGLQLSPVGNRVLYAAEQEQESVVEIFSVSTLGGTSVKLNGPLGNGGDVTPGSQQYSPDGSRVLYRADQNVDEVFEVFSVASAGGMPVRLNGALVTSGDVLTQDLQFSPDGSRVLYIADQLTDEVNELFSVPSLGGTAVKLNGTLVNGGDVLDGAKFSPNSGRVVYRANQDTADTVELYSVPSTGGTAVRLNGALVASGDVVSATFSPDGSQVVYLADQQTDEVFELFAVASGGGAARKISGPMIFGGDVTDWQFSPDGRTIVYRADQEVDSKFELFAVALTDDLPGDFNKDGFVDAADYTVWRNGLSTGKYRADEYGAWKANFGRKSGDGEGAVSPQQKPVPEPAAWVLVGGAMFVQIRRGRRRGLNARRSF